MSKRFEFLDAQGLRVNVPLDSIYISEKKGGKCIIVEVGEQESHWATEEPYDSVSRRLYAAERGEGV